MIQNVKSRTSQRPDLLVVYDTSPGAVLVNIIRLVSARAPYGAIPPGGDMLGLWDPKAVGGTQPWQRVLSMLNSVLDSPELLFDPKAMQQRVASLSEGSVGAAFTRTAAFFSFQELFTPIIGKLLSPGKQQDDVIGTSSYSLASNAAQALAADETLINGFWPSKGARTEIEVHFTTLALWLAYSRLSASSWLAAEDKPPEGAPKGEYVTLNRAKRLAAVVRVLVEQFRLVELRSRVRWLLTPAIARLVSRTGAAAVEQFAEDAKFVMAQPLHPWIAESERVLVGAKRYTRWAESSDTVGLIRTGAFAALKDIAKGTDAIGADPAFAINEIFRTDLIDRTMREAREWTFTATTVAPEDRVAAMSALGFTSTGAPPSFHLHGETFAPIITDSINSMSPLADGLDLMSKRAYRVARADGSSAFSANLSVARYVSAADFAPTADRLGRFGASSTDARPPVWITPERPERTDAWLNRELSGRALVIMSDNEFWGESDAAYAPHTVDGVARLLGLSNPYSVIGTTSTEKGHTAIQPDFQHLFTIEKGQIVPLPSDGRIFRSSRTRRPWLARVSLCEGAVPTETLAMSSEHLPSQYAVQAVVVIDDELPEAAFPMEAVVESYTSDMLKRVIG